jgi:hypothetical protein
MGGKARGDNSADHRIAYCDSRRFEPIEEDRDILPQAKGDKEEGKGSEC